MQYRTLGRTGLQVSQIGYGTWGMGSWSGTDDQEALRALQKAIDPGMRTVHNIERNCTLANEVSLPEETLHILQQHRWLRSRRQLLRYYLHIYNF